MKQSNDSTKPQYQWADRGMVQYLMLVSQDKIRNQQVAKVYYQGGEIYHSTRGLTNDLSASEVAELIRERKEYLQSKVVQRVVERLDQANKGEI
jgi:hypothetical protein